MKLFKCKKSKRNGINFGRNIKCHDAGQEIENPGGYALYIMKNDKHLHLMYITNSPTVAVIAERNSVDRIWVDLETLGKAKRQADFDSVKSNHTIEDISIIRKVIQSAALLVRINPLHEGTKHEIEEVISRGADLIMLPMYHTTDDAKRFVDVVNGRAKTMLLLETIAAEESVEETVSLSGADEIHIGLNDLHIEYKMKFMFELLANGKIDAICETIKSGGIPYGFGGIAGLDEGGLLSARIIIAEHYRLGSSMAILARSFCDSSNEKDIKRVESIFATGMKKIREYETFLKTAPSSFFEKNRMALKDEVKKIKENISTKCVGHEYKA